MEQEEQQRKKEEKRRKKEEEDRRKKEQDQAAAAAAAAAAAEAKAAAEAREAERREQEAAATSTVGTDSDIETVMDRLNLSPRARDLLLAEDFDTECLSSLLAAHDGEDDARAELMDMDIPLGDTLKILSWCRGL